MYLSLGNYAGDQVVDLEDGPDRAIQRPNRVPGLEINGNPLTNG